MRAAVARGHRSSVFLKQPWIYPGLTSPHYTCKSLKQCSLTFVRTNSEIPSMPHAAKELTLVTEL